MSCLYFASDAIQVSLENIIINHVGMGLLFVLCKYNVFAFYRLVCLLYKETVLKGTMMVRFNAVRGLI